MRKSQLLALAGVLALAAPAMAQDRTPAPGAPGAPMRVRVAAPMVMRYERGGPGGMMQNQADFLLGHTGELKLTDQQVVRLAAIARRAHDRTEGMHHNMMAQHMGAGAGEPSAADMQRMQAAMEEMHTQMRADLRDALAVLTPDQQAIAWEMAAHHEGMGGPGGDQVFVRRIRVNGPGGMHEMHDEDDDDAPPPPPRSN
jgi:hypothetical protein